MVAALVRCSSLADQSINSQARSRFRTIVLRISRSPEVMSGM